MQHYPCWTEEQQQRVHHGGQDAVGYWVRERRAGPLLDLWGGVGCISTSVINNTIMMPGQGAVLPALHVLQGDKTGPWVLVLRHTREDSWAYLLEMQVSLSVRILSLYIALSQMWPDSGWVLCGVGGNAFSCEIVNSHCHRHRTY